MHDVQHGAGEAAGLSTLLGMQVGMFEADSIFLHSRGNNTINVWRTRVPVWQKNLNEIM